MFREAVIETLRNKEKGQRNHMSRGQLSLSFTVVSETPVVGLWNFHGPPMDPPFIFSDEQISVCNCRIAAEENIQPGRRRNCDEKRQFGTFPICQIYLPR